MRPIFWLIAAILIVAMAFGGYWIGQRSHAPASAPVPDSTAAGTSPATTATELTEAPPPSIPSLQPVLSGLASNDPAIKSTAIHQLESLPLSLRNELHMRAGIANDSEVARLLEQRVKEMDTQIAFDPPPISLHVHNANLADLIGALAIATDTDIAPYFELNPKASYTLDADNKPFWDIYRELDKQAPLAIYGENDVFKFYSNLADRHMLKSAVHGPFILYTLPTLITPNTNPLPNYSKVSWNFATDPRAAALGILLQWTAIDSAGKEYDIPPPDHPVTVGRFSPILNRTGPSGSFTLPFLNVNDPTAMASVRFKVHARIDAGANYVVTEIKDIQKHLNTAIPVGSSNLIIGKMDASQTGGWSLSFSCTNANGLAYESYSLTDASGRVLLGGSGKGGAAPSSSGGSATGPFTLRVRVPQLIKTFEFDFDLK